MEIKNESFYPIEYEMYIKLFDALSHPMRIKIMGILEEERQYVSELARIINISRPLLYMHLKKLETAGLVTGHHEISDSGKAIKYFERNHFDIHLTPKLLLELARDIPVDDKENTTI